MKITAIFVLLGFMLVSVSGCDTVVNNMAFHPDKTDVLFPDELPPNVREVFIQTPDKIKLQAYFISHGTSDRLLIYFHGNAGNISHRLPDLMTINRYGLNVLGVSYRGYGQSEGEPSEKGIYTDGRSALEYATRTLGFPLEKIFIFGRSIGTTVAINTAQNLSLNGLILVSPLTSGKEMAKASGLGFVSFLAGNAFNNLARIKNVTCPVLVVHGTQDSVIPFEMGKKIYERAFAEKQFEGIEGADHNDLSTRYSKPYWAVIEQFIKSKTEISKGGS